MSVLDSNLEALEARFPGIAAFLSAQSEADGFVAEKARSGALAASYRGVRLHSAYDPEREAALLVLKEVPDSPACVAMVGFGLGYHAEAIRASRPDCDVLVLEPDPPLFRAALAVRPMEALLSDERVGFLVGAEPEALVEALERLGAERLVLFALRPLVPFREDYVARVRELAARWTAKQGINEATLRRFGRLWSRNLARNLDLAEALPGIGLFARKFAGMPAVVVAAGPSLDEALPLLPSLRERAVVVAVDTALSALLRSGVVPDFTVVVDPQYWNFRHLDRADPSGTALVTEAAAYPRVLETPFRSTFLCSSMFPLGAYVERVSGAKGKLGAGGSVATSAWDFARVLGCDPIYVAGLDLGFPRGKTHARGSHFEEKAACAGRRLRPTETLGFLALHDACPYAVPDNSGGTVLTDKRMAIYAWWFESRMARHPETRTRNLSPGGTMIPGMPFAPYSEPLALPPMREAIDPLMAEIHGIRPDRGRAARARDSLVREIDEARSLALRAVAACDSLACGGGPRAAAELDAIDAALLGSGVKDVVGFLFPKIDALFQDGASRDAAGTGRAVYGEIARQADTLLGDLERTRRAGGKT